MNGTRGAARAKSHELALLEEPRQEEKASGRWWRLLLSQTGIHLFENDVIAHC